MAKQIRGNTDGKAIQAGKRIRRHIQRLKNADGLTAGQRDQLFATVLIDLLRLEARQLRQDIGQE